MRTKSEQRRTNTVFASPRATKHRICSPLFAFCSQCSLKPPCLFALFALFGILGSFESSPGVLLKDPRVPLKGPWGPLGSHRKSEQSEQSEQTRGFERTMRTKSEQRRTNTVFASPRATKHRICSPLFAFCSHCSLKTPCPWPTSKNRKSTSMAVDAKKIVISPVGRRRACSTFHFSLRVALSSNPLALTLGCAPLHLMIFEGVDLAGVFLGFPRQQDASRGYSLRTQPM